MKTRASLFPPRENKEAQKEAPFAPFVKAERVAMMFGRIFSVELFSL